MPLFTPDTEIEATTIPARLMLPVTAVVVGWMLVAVMALIAQVRVVSVAVPWAAESGMSMMPADARSFSWRSVGQLRRGRRGAHGAVGHLGDLTEGECQRGIGHARDPERGPEVERVRPVGHLGLGGEHLEHIEAGRELAVESVERLPVQCEPLIDTSWQSEADVDAVASSALSAVLAEHGSGVGVEPQLTWAT